MCGSNKSLYTSLQYYNRTLPPPPKKKCLGLDKLCLTWMRFGCQLAQLLPLRSPGWRSELRAGEKQGIGRSKQDTNRKGLKIVKSKDFFQKIRLKRSTVCRIVRSYLQWLASDPVDMTLGKKHFFIMIPIPNFSEMMYSYSYLGTVWYILEPTVSRYRFRYFSIWARKKWNFWRGKEGMYD